MQIGRLVFGKIANSAGVKRVKHALSGGTALAPLTSRIAGAIALGVAQVRKEQQIYGSH
jgi:long-subunit acyl-CoA synthetase (AMP-forming)